MSGDEPKLADARDAEEQYYAGTPAPDAILPTRSHRLPAPRPGCAADNWLDDSAGVDARAEAENAP
jgi:hypothetical protein